MKQRAVDTEFLSRQPMPLVGGLDDLEDLYLADATMERIRKGQENIVSGSQARKELGLDH